ncbi:MAG: TRAP transporter small permease [Spirochaetes bacterium]|nr:TRAP transporter small permease [Spirochaetota bacterium]
MLKKILAQIRELDLIIAATTLGVLILFTFANVVARYFFNRPIYWGEEFQLLCIIVVVFFGVGAGFRAGSHVAIDFMVELFSEKVQKILAVFVCLISVTLILYFFIQGSVFVRQMYETQRVTNILRIPFYIIYSAFPIGCLLIIINYINATYRKYMNPREESPE